MTAGICKACAGLGARCETVDGAIGRCWLGHLSQDTTSHYEIADHEYLREAAAATDEIIREIDRHSKRSLWPIPNR